MAVRERLSRKPKQAVACLWQEVSLPVAHAFFKQKDGALLGPRKSSWNRLAASAALIHQKSEH
jgi:hypothetical protein